VQGAVEHGHAFADQDVGRVLGLAGLVEPARRCLLVRELRAGADRGGAGERQGGGPAVRFRLLRPPAPFGRRRRRRQRLQDEDAVVRTCLVAGQVAAVGQRQGAGEVELRESE
jgi:hypothetical protein